MSRLRGSLRFLDRFVQRGQELRVILAALIDGASTGFLFDEGRPRLQSQAAEFVWRQFAQFSFDFDQAHCTLNLCRSCLLSKAFCPPFY
jgi:hypothetical protein